MDLSDTKTHRDETGSRANAVRAATRRAMVVINAETSSSIEVWRRGREQKRRERKQGKAKRD